MNGNASNQPVAVINDNNDRSDELVRTTGLQFGDSSTHSYTLQWVEDKLTLRTHAGKRPVDTTIDFTAGRSMHRLKFGGGHGQPMARAVKTNSAPRICDATAGFGKDAFVFASLGCKVVLLERSVVVHALLQDGLQRAYNHTETRSIAERMTLHLIDSNDLPMSWPVLDLPQVIYLDPMYPDGKRTAKKEIQALRGLLNTQQDELGLLSAARNTAKRVVVKRPRNAPPLANVKPSGNITSTNTRYDIYSATA